MGHSSKCKAQRKATSPIRPQGGNKASLQDRSVAEQHTRQCPFWTNDKHDVKGSDHEYGNEGQTCMKQMLSAMRRTADKELGCGVSAQATWHVGAWNLLVVKIKARAPADRDTMSMLRRAGPCYPSEGLRQTIQSKKHTK